MAEFNIFGKMNEFLHAAAENLSSWLEKRLPAVGGEEWWDECVLDKLTVNQGLAVGEKNIHNLKDMDLAMLLRVAERNWYHLCDRSFFTYGDRDIVTDMRRVRNNWAHAGVSLPGKDAVVSDLEAVLVFFERFEFGGETVNEVRDAIDSVNALSSADLAGDERDDTEPVAVSPDEINAMDRVFLVSDPSRRGMVTSVRVVDGEPVYEVFIDGNLRTFYSGQLKKQVEKVERTWLDIETFRNHLTAYQINNPTDKNLYSLNSARIDFVPYQFRPVLKIVNSDAPRILIADSVGVGKTIEAGLIIKELEARNDIESVLIICPKPLVSDRKWESEMKRFDEDFVPMDGSLLRQAISDADLRGEWPEKYGKCIIPYSILDSRTYGKGGGGKGKTLGLTDLDPAPHFDLVIVDEAHHIRNGGMEKEKAFAYKCVKYFCDNSDAVVMLTATPLQTGDDNLFTLLNVLRPDVVLDRDTFDMMSRPNEHVTEAASLIRHTPDGWRDAALEELEEVRRSQWGENVIALNPVYRESLAALRKGDLSRDERVALIDDVEGLNSFSTMINRTLRKDIQDFCIRESVTVSSGFTPGQRALYDELLSFERFALETLHRCNPASVEFMMTTLKRQAASCMFGLAPHIDDIVNRRLDQLLEDSASEDGEDMYLDEAIDILRESSVRLTAMAKALPDEDPKFDKLLGVIEKKQAQDNNKIMIFSTFRHTLGYLQDRLLGLGFRVGTINGSVKDEDRRDLRNRFELPRESADALDIMLFTEVGSEGLDYQFCDTMVNYDLPWNPMAIEQRIGRIDRRGQKSEKVFIYNMITEGTVDADIYYRCYDRIGIFKHSIGDCDEILGNIAKGIGEIASDWELTDEERRTRLEQMADNERRKMKELERLESEGKEIFGIDMSEFMTSEKIRKAENPWLSPACLRTMTEAYLNDLLGPGTYMLGGGGLLHLRLSATARAALKAESDKMPEKKNPVRTEWLKYLKGSQPIHDATFDSETAEKHRGAFLISSTHPLARLAARHFRLEGDKNIFLAYASEDIAEGRYYFSLYAWEYSGIEPRTRLVVVCEDGMSQEEVTDILQCGVSRDPTFEPDGSRWEDIEKKEIAMWKAEKERYGDEAAFTASRKTESIRNEYLNNRSRLEGAIADASDEKLRRMRESQLDGARRVYEEKTECNCQVNLGMRVK